MLVYEYKLRVSSTQQAAIDEAIRITQFLRNTCLRVWLDGRRVSENDLQLACSRLAHAVAFVAPLNSQARQAAAARAWAAISRFYAHCQAKRPGKKGYPRFQRDCRSVEYKTTGWQLDPDGRHLTLTDGCGIGRMRLIGSRQVHTFPWSSSNGCGSCVGRMGTMRSSCCRPSAASRTCPPDGSWASIWAC